MENKQIIVIAGPTASGKTKLAVELAKEINGEIINADSRSIYRGMNIGTGKPKRQFTVQGSRFTDFMVEDIPHHLFDIKNPDEDFNVAEFKKLAKEKIREIQNRGKTPIIVGGTGLYIDALVYDYKMPDTKPSKVLRIELESRDADELFTELEKIDPKTAKKIDPKNKRRIIRALEIYLQTKKSKVAQETRKKLPKDVLYFAVQIPREELYAKINKRVEEMFIVQKLDDEVRKLLKKYPSDLPIMQTMGYKESAQFINNEITLEEAIAKTQQAHRNYAKKQMTWFQRNKDIVWVEADINIIKNILRKKGGL